LCAILEIMIFTTIALKLIPNKIKLGLVQMGYDYGFDHGYDLGKKDRENDIIHLIESQTENMDWLNENSLEVRNIVPLIKTKAPEILEPTWDTFNA
jgi:hypothetical protein